MCIKATVSVAFGLYTALWLLRLSLKEKRLLQNAEKLKKLILHLKTKDRIDSVSCTVDIIAQIGLHHSWWWVCCVYTQKQTIDGDCCVHTRKQTVDGVHPVSWELGLPPGRRSFLLKCTLLCRLLFRVLVGLLTHLSLPPPFWLFSMVAGLHHHLQRKPSLLLFPLSSHSSSLSAVSKLPRLLCPPCHQTRQECRSDSCSHRPLSFSPGEVSWESGSSSPC